MNPQVHDVVVLGKLRKVHWKQIRLLSSGTHWSVKTILLAKPSHRNAPSLLSRQTQRRLSSYNTTNYADHITRHLCPPKKERWLRKEYARKPQLKLQYHLLPVSLEIQTRRIQAEFCNLLWGLFSKQKVVTNLSPYTSSRTNQYKTVFFIMKRLPNIAVLTNPNCTQLLTVQAY